MRGGCFATANYVISWLSFAVDAGLHAGEHNEIAISNVAVTVVQKCQACGNEGDEGVFDAIAFLIW